MAKEVSYVQPREIEELTDCSFYHFMDLPGVGTVGDHWDLRPTIDAYLGGFDFAGKRVLDVGAASGFLSFEMEKRGADVVSFDIPDGGRWNYIPFAQPGFDAPKLVRDLRWHVDRIKNAYWYAHRALGSRARAYYGDIYDIPAGLGPSTSPCSAWCSPISATPSWPWRPGRGFPGNGRSWSTRESRSRTR